MTGTPIHHWQTESEAPAKTKSEDKISMKGPGSERYTAYLKNGENSTMASGDIQNSYLK